jgi:uncharacterized OB-fold protein
MSEKLLTIKCIGCGNKFHGSHPKILYCPECHKGTKEDQIKFAQFVKKMILK